MIITITTTDTASRRTCHLTQDEMTVLQLALNGFNEFSLPLCSEEREQQYLDALKHLQEIVTEQKQEEHQSSPVNDAKRHFETIHIETVNNVPRYVTVEVKEVSR